MREASLVLIAEVRWKAGRTFTTSSSAVRINATSSGRKSVPAISIVASREGPDVNLTPFGAGCSVSGAGTFHRKFKLQKPCKGSWLFPQMKNVSGEQLLDNILPDECLRQGQR
jgi:hypothetical protein